MKKMVLGWELDDYDGHFKPDGFGGSRGQSSISLDPDGDLRIERDIDTVCWVPLEVVAEYMRMLGWTVAGPKGEKDA